MNQIEYLDLVDDNDNVIGREERNKILASDIKNCRAINIFIFNSKNELIVPKRSSNRRIFPNCYDFSAAGYVSSGEDYQDAAYRELYEELGIRDVKLEEIGYFTPNDLDISCFVKLYKLVYDGPLNIDMDGIQQINYFDLDIVSKLLHESPNMFKGDFGPLLNWYIKNKV